MFDFLGQRPKTINQFGPEGFDIDIRGAGNLLGQEQYGHIREVGIELYQQMLEKAVAEAQGGEVSVSWRCAPSSCRLTS